MQQTTNGSSSSTPLPSLTSITSTTSPQYIPIWSKINSKDSCHRFGHASVIINDFMITIGGYSASGFYTNDIIALDLKKSMWMRLHPSGSQLPHCYGHTAVKYKESQIIVYGGHDGEKDLNTVAILTIDIVNNAIEARCEIMHIKNSRLEKYFHSAHIHGNFMYVFGGRDLLQKTGNELWCLDLENPMWTRCQTRDDCLEQRGGHCSVVHQGQLYVYGGYSDRMKAALSDMQVLDLNTLTWRKIEANGTTPGPRHGANLVAIDNKIYLFGGTTPENQFSNDIFVYNIKTNTWKKQETSGQVLSPRKYGSAVAWKSDVVVWGGRTQEDTLSEIFVLDLNYNKRLLFQTDSADLIFKVAGQEIPAHKEILYEKCKFFKNMFDSGMAESHDTTIEVPDSNIEVFKAMLSWIYLSEDGLELTPEIAEDLLELSDKYLLIKLRDKCVQYLLKDLKPEKIPQYLEISERLEITHLEESLLSYALENLEMLEANWEQYKLPENFLWRIISKLRKSQCCGWMGRK